MMEGARNRQALLEEDFSVESHRLQQALASLETVGWTMFEDEKQCISSANTNCMTDHDSLRLEFAKVRRKLRLDLKTCLETCVPTMDISALSHPGSEPALRSAFLCYRKCVMTSTSATQSAKRQLQEAEIQLTQKYYSEKKLPTR